MTRQYEIRSGNYNFPVNSLFKWTSDPNEKKITRIIYGLKQGHSRSVYSKFAELMFSRLAQEDLLDRNILFVPAPGSDPLKNHALYLARALSEFSGFEYRDILISKNSIKQKKLKKIDRFMKMQLKEGAQGAVLNKKVVFVDDVITTGRTAMAAFRALGFPMDFEVWVLAERLYFQGFTASKNNRLTE